ncbi:MAG: hypothetical protein ACP5NL_01205 [Thermoplasmata archaeon]
MSFKIHTILTREEAYLGIKNVYNGDRSSNRINARLKNVVLYNNINFAVLYLILSASFSYYLYLSHTFATLNGVYFVIYLFVFIVSLFYSTLFLSNIIDLNLIEPLKSMPVTKRTILYSITISWLLYSGLSVLFIAVPVTIVTFVIYHSLFTIIIELAWIFIVLAFGYSVGIFLSFFISSKSYRSKSRRSAVKQALKAFIVIFILLFWQLIFYLSRYMFGFFNVFSAKYSGYWFLFPFSASYSVANTFNAPFLSIFTTIAYVILFSIVLVYSGNRLNKFIFEGFYVKESSKNTKIRHSVISYKAPWLGYLIRTSHFLGRKPQALISFIIPFALFIPLIMNIIGQTNISFTYLLGFSLIIVIMLSIASLSTMVMEGKSYWVLNMLPVSKNQLAKIKSTSEFIIFAIIFSIILILMAYILNLFNFLMLLLWLIILIAAFDSLYFTNIYLFSKLTPDTDTVTAISFGGNVAGILMVFLAGILIYVPFGTVYAIKIIYTLSVSQFFGSALCAYIIVLVILNLSEKVKKPKIF